MTPSKTKSKPSIRTPKGVLRIIKKSTCCKLSPTARGELGYEIGYEDSAKCLHIRVTKNVGGFFSKQWVALASIEDTIASQDNAPFKAVIFAPLYESTSTNNHGFLGACLRDVGILEPVEDQPLCHLAGDIKAFRTAMEKLSRDKSINLPDEVAEEEAKKEARRQELISKMKKSQANSKSAAK